MSPNDNKTVVKVCPECGQPLDGFDVYAHSLAHWPEYQDPAKTSAEARKRQKELLSGGVTYDVYATSHAKEV